MRLQYAKLKVEHGWVRRGLPLKLSNTELATIPDKTNPQRSRKPVLSPFPYSRAQTRANQPAAFDVPRADVVAQRYPFPPPIFLVFQIQHIQDVDADRSRRSDRYRGRDDPRPLLLVYTTPSCCAAAAVAVPS